MGKVVEMLPGTQFRVSIDLQGKEYVIMAHLSGKMRMNYIRLELGDDVEVEISPYDLNRGIITYRGQRQPRRISEKSKR
jgi:translation initiation factor IF-1